jgi:hypothetical protein
MPCATASCLQSDAGGLDDATTVDARAPEGDSGAQGDTAFVCPAPTCPIAPVNFVLTVADPSQFCVNDCDNWLSIEAADGGDLGSYGGSDGCGATLDCCYCHVYDGGCAEPGYACIGQSLTDAGLQETWNGLTATRGACGEQALACTFETCAPAGAYLAVMCVTESDAGSQLCDISGGTGRCVRVPFDYPSTAVVRGSL